MLQFLWLAAIAYVLWSIARRVDLWYRERRFRKLYGTEKVYMEPYILPLGLDMFFVMFANYRRQDLPEFVRHQFKRIGRDTYGVKMLGSLSISTREPRNIQAILTTQFKDFGIGPARNGVFKPLLGDGIFTIDGKGWEHSRALLRPQFAKDQITHLEILEEHTQQLIKCIPSDGTPIDVQKLFFDLTIDTATEFLFGESCGSLKTRLLNNSDKAAASSQSKSFAQAFNEAQEGLINRYRLRSYYNWSNPPEFQEACRVCHDFVDRYVHKAIHMQNLGTPEVEKSGRKYVFLEAIAKETKNPILLRDSLMNILLAGRDTTAGMLSFTFYLLVRYPEVMKRLREAVKEDFGTEHDGEPITFEKLKNCTYLRWVCNEVLRLYPVVPFNVRVALKDTTFPVGGGADGKSPIFIPKGTNVEYSVYAMHRREDIWGEDANWFRPERWGESRKSGYGSFEYLPFNGGSRICIGQGFALTEASYVIVRLLQHFDNIENGDLDPFVKCYCTLTMCVGGEKGVTLKCS